MLPSSCNVRGYTNDNNSTRLHTRFLTSGVSLAKWWMRQICKEGQIGKTNAPCRDLSGGVQIKWLFAACASQS